MTQLKVKRKFNPIDLKEGRVVTIRQWDDMEKEFGIEEDGFIHLKEANFIEEMKDLCGTKVIVTDWRCNYFAFKGFALTSEMFEECYKPVRQLSDHLKGKL